jgi:uncharacterized membrane protein YebE (DUF533 family)
MVALMGLLRDLTAPSATGSASDAGLLRDLISAAVISDGTVDVAEHVTVEALYETVPQLRAAPQAVRPPAQRKALIPSLRGLEDERLKRQLFVLAVDLVLASDGAHEREDAFIEELRGALEVDDAFARATITTLAHKYARAL